MRRVAVVVLLLVPLAVLAVIVRWGARDDTLYMADAPPSWATLAPAQISEARKHGVPVAFENDLGMRFVLIPPGTFVMGSPEEEVGHRTERQHEVTLTIPFYMQVTEVTNGQYRRLRPDHDSQKYWRMTLDEDLQPVAMVTWADAREFAAWATGRSDARTYRLPSEAEWEYACRAGSVGRFSWGEDESDALRFANTNDPETLTTFARLYSDKPDTRAFPSDDGYRVTAPVGSFLPNGWGLHDMHGNVMEFCGDFYAIYPEGPVADPTGTAGFPGILGKGNPVLRGGSWRDGPKRTRSASRYLVALDSPGGMRSGFRLVASLSTPVRGDCPAWAAGEWTVNAADLRAAANACATKLRELLPERLQSEVDVLEEELSSSLSGGASAVLSLGRDGRAHRRRTPEASEGRAGTWTAVGDRVVVHWTRGSELAGEDGEDDEPLLLTRSEQGLHEMVNGIRIRYDRRAADGE